MPKPSDYTPARRRIMQVVIWVILLMTIGLAEVVALSAKRANRVELAPQTVTVDGVSVRLPAERWRARPSGDKPRMIVQAADGSPGEESRTISVLSERLDAPMSPLEYLATAFNVSPPGAIDPDNEYSHVTSLKVAGQPGVLVTVQGASVRRREIIRDLYACAVLPSLRAVVVHLRGIGEPTAADRAVVGSIAGSIGVASEPALAQAGEAVTLAESQIAFTTPKGFVAVQEADEWRTDRRLWPAPAARAKERADEFERDWTTVELVGCLAPAGKGIDAKRREKMTAAMLTLLLARDANLWRGASVTPEGDTIWRAEPARPPGGSYLFPSRAYLITDAKGLGLLAIFRGGFGGGGFDADWQTLAESVKFPTPSPIDLAALEKAGADDVARLRAQGYERLLADRQEQWWLWTGGGEHPYLGWSHVDFNINALSGKRETKQRKPGGGVSRITEEFDYRDSDARYHADVKREDSEAMVEDVQSLQQTTNLVGPQVSVGIRVRTASPTTWKSPAPANFIPGALLPLLIGKLGDQPMLLRTESFPGHEAAGAPELLSLLIRPAGTATTQKAEGEDEPMRCVTAQVNGSGRISRWLFRRSGELESVELPGGIRRVPSDQSSVQFDFAKETQMSP